MTTIPPVSQTKIEVGTVSSPGCSKTRRGLLRSPTISQMAAPKARAPRSHSPYAWVSFQCGSIPQWENFFRLMQPLAPSRRQNSTLSSLEMTATGIPPISRAIWIAWQPSPPAPPHTSTTSPARTVCGGQAASIR